ncbi:MAG TPA: MBL fold metallo-hydrolase, partial [Thermoanaerobaculia bacterium]|nr:MBL fold metallo-hydrolase [Thermoanaerobaculia bacterium]
LVPLGVNGYIPSHGRQTMAFLLLTGEAAILLDAGTGVARLLEAGVEALLGEAEALEVILTHYHLDHVVGLSFLPGVWPERPVRIHAPGPPLVDFDPAEALGRLIHPPLFPVPLPEFPMPVELDRLSDESASIGGLDVRLRRQRHPGGSAGLRFGDALAYVTDTVADAATAGFVAGADLLLHEVWTEAGGDAGATGHSAADDVARIAVEAGVRRLMPVHHHPRSSGADLERLAGELARMAPGVEVVLPEEGRVFEV